MPEPSSETALTTELERLFQEEAVPPLRVDAAEIGATVRRRRRLTGALSVVGLSAATVTAVAAVSIVPGFLPADGDRVARPSVSTGPSDVSPSPSIVAASPTRTATDPVAPTTDPQPPALGSPGTTVATTTVISASNVEELAESTVTFSSTTGGDIDRVTLSSDRLGAPPTRTWKIDLDEVTKYGVALRWTKDEAIVIVPKDAHAPIVHDPGAASPDVYDVPGTDLSVWKLGRADTVPYTQAEEDLPLSGELLDHPVPQLRWTDADGQVHANFPVGESVTLRSKGHSVTLQRAGSTFDTVDTLEGTTSGGEIDHPDVATQLTPASAGTGATTQRVVYIFPKGVTATVLRVPGQDDPVQPADSARLTTGEVVALFVYRASMDDVVEPGWVDADGTERWQGEELHKLGMEGPP